MTRRPKTPAETPSTATDRATPSARIVSCPQCHGDSVYAPSNPYRPFCSRRCKDIDFGAWADESFRVAERGDTDPDTGLPDASRRLQ